jgi:Ca-activated chloride channel family protein
MTFAHPWVLLFLVIPALLLWMLPRRPWGIALPADGIRVRRNRVLPVLLHFFDVLPILLFAIGIVIAAGPQVLRQPLNKRELTNIQICLDVSGSMSIDDRYGMAKEAIERFTKEREGDAFGLTIFGSHQIRWMPLTTDLVAIRNSLPFANPENQPIHMSGTRIGAALRFCLSNMINEAESGDRLIILVSDGESSDLGEGFAEGDIAQELSDSEITLYHIHVAREDVPADIVDIARKTGGEAFQAADAETLRKVFAHIDRMRPAKFNPQGTVPMHHDAPLAIAALALLGLHLAGSFGVRYTPW